MKNQNLSFNVPRILGLGRIERPVKGDDAGDIRATARQFQRNHAAKTETDRGDALGIDHRLLPERVQGRPSALPGQRPV